ncbi:MAG TPA: copper transporter [Actinomycetes bacterium]|nr:copper transporter [Actinomycetes bacterium]
MIDFRYHIVSIVAIFLALAVGIVLGSGPLKDDISGFLEDRTNALALDKVQLQGEVADLRTDIESSQRYAELVQPAVVSGLLVAQPVTVVVLPDASGDAVKAVEEAVDQAGGRVTEHIEIDGSWTDPDQTDVLGRVDEGFARGGDNGQPYELAGQVLASALVTDNPRLAGTPYAPATAIVGEYEKAGFVHSDEQEVSPGGSAIVVGSDVDSAAKSATLLPLISWLDSGSEGAVVSGPLPSAEDGGIVGSVRDSDFDDAVSTVDQVDTAQGVTVTVLALVDQREGQVGHYGIGPGSQGPAPDPVPGT